MGTPMDFAPKYAASGIPIFPVNGKFPLTKRGFFDATCDLAQIERWKQQFPQANVAIRTGSASRLLVVDVDDRHGGSKSLQALEEEYGPLPETREARTGTGGRHIYLLLAEGQIIPSSTGRLAPGLDIRAEGGYIVASPSIHPDTQQPYVWIRAIKAAPIPAWFAELLLALAHPKVGAADQTDSPIAEGQRNATLTSLAGTMRRRGFSAEAISAALVEENAKKCKPPLPEREVRQIAYSVARYAPAEQERGEERPEPPKPNGQAPPAAEIAEEVTPAAQRKWPAPLTLYAFLGITGELVRMMEPHTEADPAALLVETLAGAGTLFGHRPYFPISGGRHFTNTFHCLVGQTSVGRKGSGWDCVQYVLNLAYPDWAKDHITGGLSSGEGLTWAVRDAIWKRMRQKDGSYEEEEIDSGVIDKRLMLVETEFASILKVMGREANTLNPTIRQAWDSGNLRAGNLVKGCSSKATGAHITLVGHVTRHELLRLLSEADFASGFINRFLWTCTRKSKNLPSGGYLHRLDLDDVVSRLRAAVDFARTVDEMRRSPEAERIWAQAYDKDLNSARLGSYGDATGRAAPQVLRLSMIYALLDSSAVILPEHLLAALAVWQYCLESAQFIFGDSLGYPVAEEILKALREGPEGLTRTQVSQLFKGHKAAKEINAALLFLEELTLARRVTEKTEGRSTERWFAV